METETVERTKWDGPQVGDILVSSWGYDQTNVDFWRVVGLTPSAKSARIMALPQRVVDCSHGSERVVAGQAQPQSVDPDDLVTSLVRWYDFRDGREWCVGVPVGHTHHKLGVRVRWNTAHLWDGRPLHQTAWSWGH